MTFTKETAKRAIRTFLQAFLPALVVGLKTIDFSEDKSIVKGAVIALVIPSIAAGLSAVMNLEKPTTDCSDSDEDYYFEGGYFDEQD
jgi:hypothetical protein